MLPEHVSSAVPPKNYQHSCIKICFKTYNQSPEKSVKIANILDLQALGGPHVTRPEQDPP